MTINFAAAGSSSTADRLEIGSPPRDLRRPARSSKPSHAESSFVATATKTWSFARSRGLEGASAPSPAINGLRVRAGAADLLCQVFVDCGQLLRPLPVPVVRLSDTSTCRSTPPSKPSDVPLAPTTAPCPGDRPRRSGQPRTTVSPSGQLYTRPPPPRRLCHPGQPADAPARGTRRSHPPAPERAVAQPGRRLHRQARADRLRLRHRWIGRPGWGAVRPRHPHRL